jgi:hypothetical protein
MRARSQRSAGIVDQETLAEAIGEGANMQHGRAFRAARSLWQGRVGAGAYLGADARVHSGRQFFFNLPDIVHEGFGGRRVRATAF